MCVCVCVCVCTLWLVRNWVSVSTYFCVKVDVNVRVWNAMIVCGCEGVCVCVSHDRRTSLRFKETDLQVSKGVCVCVCVCVWGLSPKFIQF